MDSVNGLSLSFRKEVLDYLHSCEHLLGAMSMPDTSRFTMEELEVLEYTVAELQKVLVVCTKQ